MIYRKINNEQANYAWKLVKEYNFGNRGKFDGDIEKQYTGMLGQVVMADELDLPRPTGKEGFDNGIDFVILGKTIDLKTMGRTTDVKDYYVNNLVASQTNYQTEYYVFSSINKTNRIITFIGVIKKENLDKFFKEEGESRERSDGTKFNVKTDMYEIPNKELHKINTWRDLVIYIDSTK